MDQYISAIIIAVIGGVFGVITLVLQNKLNRDVTKIDNKANTIKKEKKLKNDLAKSREALENTVYQIMILILDTNLEIMKHTSMTGDQHIRDTVYEAEQLKEQFKLIDRQIKDINHDYELLLEVAQEIQSSSDHRH